MLIDTTLLADDNFVIEGLRNGTMQRWGGGIRWAAGHGPYPGTFVRHLLETPGTTEASMREAVPKLLRGADAAMKTAKQVGQVQQTLSSVLQLSQIAAGASVLNLGVSVVGFAYMGYKLHQLQKSMDRMRDELAAGFSRMDGKLDRISGQLSYLLLLVEENGEEQRRLGVAVAELHRATLMRELADLYAATLDRSRFPDGAPQDVLRTAARVRMTMADQASRLTAELDPRTLLIADLATQGWAAAAATESTVLLEIGHTKDARQLLEEESRRFAEHARRWTGSLVATERPELATAWRFGTPRLAKHVSSERLGRIVALSPADAGLPPQAIVRLRNEATLELEMSHNQSLGEVWDHRQIATAEFLDTLSELSGRLDSLHAFARTCDHRGVSSRELLPGKDARPGLHVIDAAESSEAQ